MHPPSLPSNSVSTLYVLILFACARVETRLTLPKGAEHLRRIHPHRHQVRPANTSPAMRYATHSGWRRRYRPNRIPRKNSSSVNGAGHRGEERTAAKPNASASRTKSNCSIWLARRPNCCSSSWISDRQTRPPMPVARPMRDDRSRAAGADQAPARSPRRCRIRRSRPPAASGAASMSAANRNVLMVSPRSMSIMSASGKVSRPFSRARDERAERQAMRADVASGRFGTAQGGHRTPRSGSPRH